MAATVAVFRLATIGLLRATECGRWGGGGTRRRSAPSSSSSTAAPPSSIAPPPPPCVPVPLHRIALDLEAFLGER